MAGSYDRLSAQDASFILLERPATHMHITIVAVFEMAEHWTKRGGLDIDELREYVNSRLDDLPSYRKRLAFTPIQGHPIWVDDARFDPRYHVRLVALPKPGNGKQLRDLAGQLASQQLDRDRPLWELWFVEGLEGGRFAMVGKAHHSMVDGISGVSLVGTLLDTSKRKHFEPAARWAPKPPPGRLDLLVDETMSGLPRPAPVLLALRRALENPAELSTRVQEGVEAVWQAVSAGVHTPSDTPLNGPIGAHRRIDWQDLDLAAVKDVKKRLDGTVNDVILTVVTGALRHFFKRRRVAVRGMDFRVVIPVNVRSEGEDATGVNRLSALFLSLPVAERNPVRRFKKIRSDTQRLKQSRTAQGVDLLSRFMDWTESDLLTSLGQRVASAVRPYNMIVSNVPGPQLPLYLLGSRLEGMYPQMPLFESQGLGITILSYCGKVCFGLTGDWDLVPDLSAFAEDIESSFADLRSAAEQLPR